MDVDPSPVAGTNRGPLRQDGDEFNNRFPPRPSTTGARECLRSGYGRTRLTRGPCPGEREGKHGLVDGGTGSGRSNNARTKVRRLGPRHSRTDGRLGRGTPGGRGTGTRPPGPGRTGSPPGPGQRVHPRPYRGRRKQGTMYPVRTPRASSWGHPCRVSPHGGRAWREAVQAGPLDRTIKRIRDSACRRNMARTVTGPTHIFTQGLFGRREPDDRYRATGGTERRSGTRRCNAGGGTGIRGQADHPPRAARRLSVRGRWRGPGPYVHGT